MECQRMFRTILLFLTLYPVMVFGCSCGYEHKTFKETFADYDVIFVGVAQHTERNPGDWESSFYKTEMKIQKVWKGEKQQKSLFLKTQTEKNSCGGPAPQIGHTFLVFAIKSKDGLFTTGGCSMFMDLDQVKLDLNELNKEAKTEFEAIHAKMWSDLGAPIVVHY